MTGALASEPGLSATRDRMGRAKAVTVAAMTLAIALAAMFAGLGIWQIERRAWKLDLIRRVEARLGAPAVQAPGRAEWPRISGAEHEYLRVRLDGRFLTDRSVRVMAVTERGSGFWLVTPLQTAAGDTVLVNRGFVPPEGASEPDTAPGPVSVTGLMRMSEPGGGFLRANDPADGRWYSRDVAAIAQARGLGPVAPYFVDADASGNGPGRPVGGLTVVSFRNSHLVYALTWFALAAMSAGAGFLLAREGRR